jgi:hypothetical protein
MLVSPGIEVADFVANPRPVLDISRTPVVHSHYSKPLGGTPQVARGLATVNESRHRQFVTILVHSRAYWFIKMNASIPADERRKSFTSLRSIYLIA